MEDPGSRHWLLRVYRPSFRKDPALFPESLRAAAPAAAWSFRISVMPGLFGLRGDEAAVPHDDEGAGEDSGRVSVR